MSEQPGWVKSENFVLGGGQLAPGGSLGNAGVVSHAELPYSRRSPDLNTDQRCNDNYRLKKKVFRNSSHYFSKAQNDDVLPRHHEPERVAKLLRRKQKTQSEIDAASPNMSLFDLQTQLFREHGRELKRDASYYANTANGREDLDEMVGRYLSPCGDRYSTRRSPRTGDHHHRDSAQSTGRGLLDPRPIL